MRSLISAFVIRLMESIISRLATGENSIFELVSVAEQAGLNLTLSETSKTGFVATRPIFSTHTGCPPLFMPNWLIKKKYGNILSLNFEHDPNRLNLTAHLPILAAL